MCCSLIGQVASMMKMSVSDWLVEWYYTWHKIFNQSANVNANASDPTHVAPLFTSHRVTTFQIGFLARRWCLHMNYL